MEFRVMGKPVRYGWLIFAVILVVLLFRRCGMAPKWGRYVDAGRYQTGNFEYQARDISSIEINWVDDDITIVRKDSGTLQVAETRKKLSNAQKMRWRLDGSKLILQYCKSGYIGRIPSKAKKLRVEVPAGIDIDINAVSADIKLENRQDFGEININTVSGDIEASTAAARKAKLSTVSGDCSLDEIQADNVEINTTSGDITLGLDRCDKADLNTISGEVRLLSLPDGGAKIDFDHVSGDLHAQNYSSEGKEYVFGQGKCKVSVSTVSGDLTVMDN